MGLPLQFQIDQVGWVVISSNPHGFRQLEALDKEGLGDVVHENPYAALKRVLTNTMELVALKEQGQGGMQSH